MTEEEKNKNWHTHWLASHAYCLRLEKALDAAREGLREFCLGHEHAPDLPHTRAMGDTYGWCDHCSTKVSWGPGYAEQVMDEINKIVSGEE